MHLTRVVAGPLAALCLPLAFMASALAADTTLTPTGLVQVEVGASEDSWGDKLNANAATVNNLFTTGPALKLANGGTGGTTAAAARANLGVSAMGADATYAARASNLSDLASVATARSNLGVAAAGVDTTYAYRSNNLSDLANVTIARANLGVTATGADTTYATRANNLSDLANPAATRANLGLGTMATQGSGSVSIIGGVISGITDLAVADGGTGASNVMGARANLGLGSMATQDANSVMITGGALGGVTASMTTLTASGATTFPSATMGSTASDPISGSFSGYLFNQDGRLALSGNGTPALRLGRFALTGNLVQIFYGTSVVGTIATDGSSTSYNTTSDYRAKAGIEPLNHALDRLNLLQPKRFYFRTDTRRHMVDGFIAHEVAKVVPEAVTGAKDAVDEKGAPILQAMDASKLVPLLVASVKELKAANDNLGARVATLEAAGR